MLRFSHDWHVAVCRNPSFGYKPVHRNDELGYLPFRSESYPPAVCYDSPPPALKLRIANNVSEVSDGAGTARWAKPQIGAAVFNAPYLIALFYSARLRREVTWYDRLHEADATGDAPTDETWSADSHIFAASHFAFLSVFWSKCEEGLPFLTLFTLPTFALLAALVCSSLHARLRRSQLIFRLLPSSTPAGKMLSLLIIALIAGKLAVFLCNTTFGCYYLCMFSMCRWLIGRCWLQPINFALDRNTTVTVNTSSCSRRCPRATLHCIVLQAFNPQRTVCHQQLLPRCPPGLKAG